MSLTHWSTLILLLLFPVAKAQTIFAGRVLKVNTTEPIRNAKVINTKTLQSTISDSLGNFTLKAAQGDVIVLSAESYSSDTAYLINVKPRDFHLQPKYNQLNEVKIRSVKTHLGNLYDSEYHGQTVRYQRNADGSARGGLVFRFWYWNKDSKRERRSQQRLKDLDTQRKIDQVFSTYLIAKYIPLSGKELLDFRNLYRPSTALYNSRRFNMILYLNDCFKEFKDLPPEKRKLPSLKNLSP